MCYRENPGEMRADDALRPERREKILLRGQFRVRLPSEEPEEQCAWAQCLPGARSHGQHGRSYLAAVLGTNGLAQCLAHSKCSTKSGLQSRPHYKTANWMRLFPVAPKEPSVPLPYPSKCPFPEGHPPAAHTCNTEEIKWC